MPFVDIRGAIRGAVAGARGEAGVNGQNDILVAQGYPPYTEMTRKGGGYQTMATGAVAGLVVRPTTVAGLEIYNNTANAGPSASLIIDRIFTQWLVSTAVVEGAILYAMVTLPKAAPADAALAVNSNSGKPATTRRVLTAAGSIVVDNGWFPYGPGFVKAAGGVVPFGGMVAEIAGRLIVPPSCSLCIHVLSSLVGDTFTSGAAWYEEALALQ